MPPTSPKSVGFSTAQCTPIAWAVIMRRARAQRPGIGVTPAGCARVRSRGVCATENNSQGGAAKSAWKRPARTHSSTLSATSGLVRSWSLPPMAMSSPSTSAPLCRSSDDSVDGAVPSPAKTIRTPSAARGAVCVCAGDGSSSAASTAAGPSGVTSGERAPRFGPSATHGGDRSSRSPQPAPATADGPPGWPRGWEAVCYGEP
eukprot:133901-Pleurochrysis_carterae.AAC.1